MWGTSDRYGLAGEITIVTHCLLWGLKHFLTINKDLKTFASVFSETISIIGYWEIVHIFHIYSRPTNQPTALFSDDYFIHSYSQTCYQITAGLLLIASNNERWCLMSEQGWCREQAREEEAINTTFNILVL